MADDVIKEQDNDSKVMIVPGLEPNLEAAELCLGIPITEPLCLWW